MRKRRCASEIYKNTTSKLIKATYTESVLKISNAGEEQTHKKMRK